MSSLEPALLHNIAKRMDGIESVLSRVGELLCKMQQENLNIRTKSNPMDLVTEADLASERLIIGKIRELFPEDRILAEESLPVGEISAADFCWMIDPVDGTINYAHGLPLYGVSVGLTHKNVPVAGTVAFPALGDVYRGVLSRGATKNGQPIRVTTEMRLDRSLVVTGFPSNRREVMDALIGGVESILKNARGMRRTGAATLDLCWLAEGRFGGFYEVGLNPWDVCAGGLIALEAGAVVTDFRNNPFDPFARELLAANSALHAQLLEALKPFIDKL